MHKKLLGAAFALCAIVASLYAQEFRGTITGRVSDAQQAMVPGVRIELIHIDTGGRYETVSAQDGLYTAPFLTPGLYRVTAETAGFKRYVREGVRVSTNERTTLDIPLEVGDVVETVTVSAEVPLLQTASASTGQVLNERQIENIPINGRVPMVLAQRAYGVIVTSESSLNRVRPTDNAFASGMSMGGAPQTQNEILIDGAQNTRKDNTMAYSPPVDTVAEVKVEAFKPTRPMATPAAGP